jgi:hypothetical protein
MVCTLQIQQEVEQHQAQVSYQLHLLMMLIFTNLTQAEIEELHAKLHAALAGRTVDI